MRVDCDRDTILLRVRQHVVACHEGYRSCFFRAVTDKAERKALQGQAAKQAQSQTTTLGDLLAEKLAEKADQDSE